MPESSPPPDLRALVGRARAWVGAHRRVAIGSGVALVALVLYPWAGGAVAAKVAASKATARLGRPVTVESGRAGLWKVTLRGLKVAGVEGGPTLFEAERVVVPFGVAFGGKGPVELRGPRAYVVRGATGDNVSSILQRLRGRGRDGDASAGDAEPPGARRGRGLPGVAIEGGAVEIRDGKTGLSLSVGGIDGVAVPDERVNLRLGRVRGLLVVSGVDRGPSFGADEIGVQAALDGLRPAGIPALRVKGGYATPLPTLALTGITGVIAPDPGATVPPSGGGARAAGAGAGGPLQIDLHGSYGGAREALWTAKGHANLDRREGTLSLRAEQFSLDKIADVLPRSVLRPADTRLDAAFDLRWAGEAVTFGGDMAVVGLSLQHDALAPEPVTNVSMGLAVRGVAYPARRRVELERLEARVRDVTATLSGSVELGKGTHKFANGTTLGFVPRIDLALAVPRIPCAKLLGSIPPALVPHLQGFVLQGTFEARLAAKVDYADLDAVALEGKVGIDGCKVKTAPEAVSALAGPGSLLLTVDVPPPPGPGAQPGVTEPMDVVVGADNPDFVPYDQISPYLISSIMTTEDNGFFKHRGWVSSEFKNALRRNLERGAFRGGASSITMQMVKNVLLSQEKTLSRKLQELFLVWYLEQVLPKERILELYFNAIEFGPRIYGIGAAARHYFGKPASELTPLEGAFFSSILPSPKRRYVQYCHGSLLPQWDRYVRRILAKVHERGRITDDEYAAWSAQPLVFDRREATFTEKQCVDWVKTMTTRPEAEVPPELDDDGADEGAGAWRQKKLRKLFVRGAGGGPTKGRSVATRAQ